MDPILSAKLVSIAVLGICSMICGMIPMAVLNFLRWRNHEGGFRLNPDSLFFSLCLCFGAGVLLSALLCHMIPESLEAWDDLNTNDSEIPVPNILIGVGFFLVYIVEDLAHKLMHRTQKSADVELAPLPKGDATIPPAEGASAPKEQPHGHGQHGNSVHDAHEQAAHSHGAALASVQGGSVFVVIVLLIGLSFHAVFEGLAVGAEKTEDDVYVMLGAVCGHKFVMVFILGIEMLETSLHPLAQFGCVCIFTGASLLGIGIGIAVLQLGGDNLGNHIALMVSQTLASGTLMYVCFMEVLMRERSRHGHTLLRFTATLIGFAVLALLISLLPEPEDS